MRKKTKPSLVLTLSLVTMLFLFFAFSGTVYAQIPAPIGDPAYMQKECFDSNPTTGMYDNIGTPTGVIENVYDGDPENTLMNFMYGSTASGYVEVSAFRKPSDWGYPDFAITWIDIKISYRATSLSTNDDRYRILAYVDPSATPIVLQDWVTGNEAKYDPGLAQRGIRTFSAVAKPGDLPPEWTWADLANLRVRFETEQVGINNWQRVYLYEVWVTAYSTPYPEPGTMSVQTSYVTGLPAGMLFYVDLYVTDVVKMWGFQIKLDFDPGVLMPLGYINYGPFVSALPSEIGANYYALAAKTYDGDPTGFTGNTPICRMYFMSIAEGISPLTLTGWSASDVFAEEIVLTPVDGIFVSLQYPEFPLGLGAILMLAPMIPIVYVWRNRKKVGEPT